MQISEHNVLTNHLQLDRLNQPISQQDPQHTLVPHNTIVLAWERNGLKRKMFESLYIDQKAAKLCNTGVSVEMPAVWNICVDQLEQRELAKLD